MTRPTTIALYSFYHVGCLIAAAFVIVAVLDARDAVQMWMQARRES